MHLLCCDRRHKKPAFAVPWHFLQADAPLGGCRGCIRLSPRVCTQCRRGCCNRRRVAAVLATKVAPHSSNHAAGSTPSGESSGCASSNDAGTGICDREKRRAPCSSCSSSSSSGQETTTRQRSRSPRSIRVVLCVYRYFCSLSCEEGNHVPFKITLQIPNVFCCVSGLNGNAN